MSSPGAFSVGEFSNASRLSLGGRRVSRDFIQVLLDVDMCSFSLTNFCISLVLIVISVFSFSPL